MLCVQGSVDLLVQRAEIADWQCWIGVAKDRPNRSKGRLGRSPKPDVKIRAGHLGTSGKVGLVALLAHTMVADGVHDADHRAVRLGPVRRTQDAAGAADG